MCSVLYTVLGLVLKGQFHEIFDFRFFSHQSISPKPPSIPLGLFLNFFENSRRYSKLKVHHRCCDTSGKWKKSLPESFNYFVWTSLGSRITYRSIFSFKFTVRCKRSDIVTIICHRCHSHRWQAASVMETGGSFRSVLLTQAVPVVKFAHKRCRW